MLGALPAMASAGTAYVLNATGVSVVDTATNKVKDIKGQTEVPIGTRPARAAITPDGRFLYTVNTAATPGSGGVSVINTATNEVVEVAGKREIPIGFPPAAIAITPDGRFAYVVDSGGVAEPGGVSVINTATNEVVEVGGKERIQVGNLPAAIAITPDGRFAYVVNFDPGDFGGVSVIETATNKVLTVDGSKEIKVGENPRAIAITPDGRFAYVANRDTSSVSVIETATNKVLTIDGSKEIPVGQIPNQIAITPDGRFVYVVVGGGALAVIETAQNRLVDLGGTTEIPLGVNASGIAITPDGRFVYVSTGILGPPMGGVSVIETATNKLVDLGANAITVGKDPLALAIAPNQAPTASFTATLGPFGARPGVPVSFDTSASKDPDSSIARYEWSFGDAQATSLGTAGTTHTFATPGTYQVSLKETDASGCSTPNTFLFTGQTASCSGSAGAQTAATIKVAYPGVKVSCPKRAKRKGCSFKLQVVAAKPKKGKAAKVESLLVKAKVKAGRSAVVTVEPKPEYAAEIGVARSLMFKQTMSIGRETRTRFVKLQVVQ